jgi:hypothetical protein
MTITAIDDILLALTLAYLLLGVAVAGFRWLGLNRKYQGGSTQFTAPTWQSVVFAVFGVKR